MAVIEYDEYKQKLQALKPALDELERAQAIDDARQELSGLQRETEIEGFWSDLEHSQKVSQQIRRLENKIKKHDRLVSDWEDCLTLCEMAQEEMTRPIWTRLPKAMKSCKPRWKSAVWPLCSPENTMPTTPF